MANIDEGHYVCIQGWMLTSWGLYGDELLTFAIIYGFSQDGAGWYFGGREYIADWLGCSTKKVSRILKSLEDKGMIERVEVSGHDKRKNKYRSKIGDKTSHNRGQIGNNMGQNVPQIGDKLSHINIKGNITEKKIKREGFSKPTREEVRAYFKEKSFVIDPDYFYDYYESVNWYRGKTKMKNWKMTASNWNSKEKKTDGDIYDNEYADVW